MADERSKQELVSRYRTEAILAATRRVIERDGAEFTLEKVAEEAEVAKGTIYLYFSSKDELIFSMIKEISDQLIEQSRQLLDSQEPFRLRLQRMIQAQVEFVEFNRNFFLYYHMKKGGSSHATQKELQSRLKEQYENYTDMLATHFQRAMDNGDIRQLEPLKLALIFTGIVDAVLANRVLADSGTTSEREALFVLDLLFSGIAPNNKEQG